LATRLTMRGGEEAPYITDNGNVILDLMIDGGITDAPALATSIKTTIGVVEHGLFIGMADTCMVAGADGALVVGRRSSGAIA
jgi:ribose 5-phosphate isomerase A